MQDKILICVKIDLPEDADTFMGVEVADCDGGYGTVVLAVDPDEVYLTLGSIPEIETTEFWGNVQSQSFEEIENISCTWMGFDVYNKEEIISKITGKDITWH
jgi:hypothetical protein